MSDHPRMDKLAQLLQPLGEGPPRAVHEHLRPPRCGRSGRCSIAPLIRRLRDRLRGLQPGRDPHQQAEPRGRAGSGAGRGEVRPAFRFDDPYHAGPRFPWGGGRSAARLDSSFGAAPHSVTLPGDRPRLLRRIDSPTRQCHGTVAESTASSTASARRPPADREAIRREWECNGNDFVLGCLARIESQKNPLFLVGLLPDLPEHVRLVWVGDGSLRGELLETAQRLGVRHRIHVDGWRSDGRSRLAGFDLFALAVAVRGVPVCRARSHGGGFALRGLGRGRHARGDRPRPKRVSLPAE